MIKLLNFSALLGVGLIVVGELFLPAVAFAQTITISAEMLERCNSEGLNGETCACWFAAIAEAEGLEEFTEEDIDTLAPDYQDELAACMEANQ